MHSLEYSLGLSIPSALLCSSLGLLTLSSCWYEGCCQPHFMVIGSSSRICMMVLRIMPRW